MKVQGSIKGIPEAYRQLYEQWLPTSPYEVACALDVERYDVRDETVEILLPVKRK
jgi:predicted transcriptional regulator YdeE